MARRFPLFSPVPSQNEDGVFRARGFVIHADRFAISFSGFLIALIAKCMI